jgi:hypothetical protein
VPSGQAKESAVPTMEEDMLRLQLRSAGARPQIAAAR